MNDAQLSNRQNHFRVLNKGNGQVLFLITRASDGMTTAVEVHWKLAQEIARAIVAVSKKAEEIENVERIIRDGALLDRLQIPIGLTNNPAIKDEIRKEAQWDRELRRHVPTPSIASKEVFGTPTITNAPPKSSVTDLTDEERAELRRRLERR